MVPVVNVRSNIALLMGEFRHLGREQIKLATKVAINSTARAVRQAHRDEMPRVLDRPTPYTLNSLFLEEATNANPVARVGLKDDMRGGVNPSNYLEPQIVGGKRRLKRFERALRAIGALPTGMIAVPASGAKLDAFGNMQRGQIIQILSALGAAEQVAGFMANRTASSIKRRGRRLPQFFVGRPGNGRLPPGVWQRFTFPRGAIKPVLIFVRDATYKVRYKFDDVSAAVIAREFTPRMRAALHAVGVR